MYELFFLLFMVITLIPASIRTISLPWPNPKLGASVGRLNSKIHETANGGILGSLERSNVNGSRSILISEFI